MTAVFPATTLPLIRHILRWTKLVFTPLSLLVIGWFIWQSRISLGDMLQEGQWLLLLLALLLWIGTNLLAPLVSVYIFRTCHIDIAWLTALHIHCSRLPAKYLPGGIWHSLGRANDYYNLGHGVKMIGFYFVLENFLLITVTLLMSAGVVQDQIESPNLRIFVQSLPILMGIALLIFPAGARLFMKMKNTFSVKAYFKAVIVLFVYWCIVGLTFACYISAFTALALNSSLVEMASIYIFSWSIGYLALFAPQGIGVAEFIAGNLLTRDNQVGQILAFLIGFRVLILIADLATWAIAGMLKPKP